MRVARSADSNPSPQSSPLAKGERQNKHHRFIRAFVIALLTAFAGCILAVFVGDYLTKLAHAPEMEGQRGMTVFFLCVPLGILAGLVIGVIISMLVRRQGAAGFLIVQSWSLLIVCGIAGLLGGVPYLLSDKPPQIDSKDLELEFEPVAVWLSNALVSYAKYFLPTFWPNNLAVYYPFAGLWVRQIFGAAFLLIGITAFCLLQRRIRPYLIVGWLWFLETLVPVIGTRSGWRANHGKPLLLHSVNRFVHCGGVRIGGHRQELACCAIA